MWYLNIVLKARQLGISTFVAMFFLDTLLHNENTTAGIIDATLPDAKKKLKKVRYAFENLHPWVTEEALKIKLVKDNEQELTFSNGSSITADTSFRGDTVQYLHISEYAKICAKEPIKAKEIRTGALNAVAKKQMVFIESTAEGSEGDFYNRCMRAENMKLAKKKLTELDYRFFFFPWYKHPEYTLDCPEDYQFNPKTEEYFDSIEATTGHEITRDRRYWYIKKKEDQGEEMKQEYPSTSKEAFEVSDEDKYYRKEMIKVRQEDRIREFGVIRSEPVHTYWDLGRNDYTSIIFAQIIGTEVRILDFIEETGEALPFYIDLVKEKGYRYGTMWLPHDSKHDLLATEKNVYTQLTEAGFQCGLVPKMKIDMGIREARKVLAHCWFNESKTKELVHHLDHYKKKWSELMGKYVGAMHDKHSHAADAFRYLAVSYREQNPEPVKVRTKTSEQKMAEDFWTEAKRASGGEVLDPILGLDY